MGAEPKTMDPTLNSISVVSVYIIHAFEGLTKLDSNNNVVGLGWLLGIFFGMGLTGIWIAMAADEIFRGVVVLIRWIKGGWRGKRVVLEEKTNSNGTAKATA